ENGTYIQTLIGMTLCTISTRITTSAGLFFCIVFFRHLHSNIEVRLRLPVPGTRLMRTVGAGLIVLALAHAVFADESKQSERKTFQIPYRLTSTNHILVRAKINGKGPYNFILDTGAPAVFVATAVCRNLGVAADKEKWGSLDRFEIEGGVVLQKIRIRVEDPFQLQGMNGLGLAGAELHGIIGYTLLARYATEFDFSKPKLAWTELNFTPPFPEGLSG